MLSVRVAYVGRNYDAARSMPQQLSLPDGATVDDALHALAGHLPADRPLSPSCLVAVSGLHLGTLADHVPRPLHDGDELFLLSPVAGG